MTRTILPARRAHELIEFFHQGHVFAAGVGTDAEGQPLELFLHAGKAGTLLEATSRDAAVLLSFALQYGAPIAEIRRAMTRTDDGGAAGPVGALLDLMAATEGGEA
jgi:hypothetical protein